MNATTKQKIIRLLYRIIGALAWLLWGLLPIALSIAFSSVGKHFCTALNEAHAKGCTLFGLDVNSLFYTGAVYGWFFILTVPLGALAAIVWLILYPKFHYKHLGYSTIVMLLGPILLEYLWLILIAGVVWWVIYKKRSSNKNDTHENSSDARINENPQK